MAYRNDILLGRITKISGYEGAVTVKLESRFTENIPELESVFLEIDGRPVPFFISASEYSGADILKLRFVGYESAEKISEFTGCNVFLTGYIPPIDPEDEMFNIIGYKVLIRDEFVLGYIKELIPNSGQWLLKVGSQQKKEILIPFHEDFIIRTDRKNKIIVMDIPEGLTEIN